MVHLLERRTLESSDFSDSSETCLAASQDCFVGTPPLLTVDYSRVLDNLNKGASVPSPLPDLVTSCDSTIHEPSVVIDSRTCSARACRDVAKLVGRRLRYLADAMELETLCRGCKTREPMAYDWLSDLLATCVSSVVSWWKNSV